MDTLRRAYDLLDATLAHYISGEPDDPSVRAKCKSEDIALDDVVPPLALLLRRIISEDEKSRVRVKQWLLPSDM